MRIIQWYLTSALIIGMTLGIALYFLDYEQQLRDYLEQALP